MKVKIQFEIETDDVRLCGKCEHLLDLGNYGPDRCALFQNLVGAACIVVNKERCPDCLAATVKFWRKLQEGDSFNVMFIWFTDGHIQVSKPVNFQKCTIDFVAEIPELEDTNG